MRPVFPLRLKRLADQQAGKTGTINEKITLDPIAILHHQRADVAALRALLNTDNPAFGSLCSIPFGKFAQIRSEQRRIELISIIIGRQEMIAVGYRRAEAVFVGHDIGDRIGEEVGVMAFCIRRQ